MLRFILILFFSLFATICVAMPLESSHSDHISPSSSQKNLIGSAEERLVNFVRQTIASIRYSAYKLGGSQFDTSNGIYIVDCSSYVDHLLLTVSPSSYLSLVRSCGTDTPTTQHYYNFFVGLAHAPHHYWSKVKEVKDLQPGDILVFRNKNKRGNTTAGHVMVVMNKPIRDHKVFLVRVADSAPAGHSGDTRLPHVSGIGIGSLMLKASPKTGLPYAYAWKIGSCWKKNVKFAMARPINKT